MCLEHDVATMKPVVDGGEKSKSTHCRPGGNITVGGSMPLFT